MKTRTVLLALAIAAALTAAFVGYRAATDIRYEDCETSDQANHEPDCGFWTYANQYRLGVQPGPEWRWVWWPWVTVGAYSVHQDGWKPPHGLQPPREDADAETRRKRHQNSRPATTNTRPANGGAPAARQQGGNQGFKNKDRTTTTTTQQKTTTTKVGGR